MNLSKVMSRITVFLYALLLGYIGAWFMGVVHGDFSLVLFVLVAVTFVFWVFDKVYLKPQRMVQAKAVQAQIAKKEDQTAEERAALVCKAVEPVLTPPWWIEWTAGFFWVILIVFLLRSFVAEPFRIPSGSMEPTLVPRDFILVNKFTYGLRMPVLNIQLTQGTAPQRGDVVVFRWPGDERITYIKRVIGLPGDVISYRNKVLTINGVVVPTQAMPQGYSYYEQGDAVLLNRLEERLGEVSHQIVIQPRQPTYVMGAVENFPYKENCSYRVDGFVCTVPPRHYFMMGDNRDHSSDSRYWGFVPEGNIVGKAFFIWMNPGQLSRIGSFQ